MPGASEVRWAAALAALAAWGTTVPWLAAGVGLGLDVPTRLEVADHVIPGLVALGAAAVLALLGRWPDNLIWFGAGSVTLLAGLWITATHCPLILDALKGAAPWGAALVHFSAGPPILMMGLWMLLRSQHSPPGSR